MWQVTCCTILLLFIVVCSFQPAAWSSIEVGDVVMLKNNDFVPVRTPLCVCVCVCVCACMCDIVILSVYIILLPSG